MKRQHQRNLDVQCPRCFLLSPLSQSFYDPISSSGLAATTMAQPSVLDYETQLGFRRLYRHGWKAGLPRRRRKSTYPDYGRGREALSTLLSGIDAIKEPLAHIPVESYYQMLTAVREKADVPISSLGHSLWPIEDGKTPAFIDPETGLKFSNSADRERY